MTPAQAVEAIKAAFVVGWSTAQPAVPLALENEALPSADSFVHLAVTLPGGQQMTQGGRGTRRVQRSGWVIVKLWTLAGQGSAAADALAGSVRAILEESDIPGPVSGEPITMQVAVDGPAATDARWFMTLVRVPFWFAETV